MNQGDLGWGWGCTVLLQRGKNRQLMFGSRWGDALSTGAAQMPPKQSENQLPGDTPAPAGAS